LIKLINHNRVESLGMAIIVEEEKRRTNWFSLILVISLAGMLVALIYYLFFAPTPLIEKVISQNMQSLKELSGIKLNAESLVNNPKFQILKQYINPIEGGTTGKSDLFVK